MIYLDNAATTFPKPESVYVRMESMARNGAVNAGRGSYKLAREAVYIADETKSLILKMLNISNGADVVFSPSITVGMNQIISGIKWNSGEVIYVSPYEHNAVARTLHYKKKKTGIVIKELPLVKGTLEIDLDKMKYEFAKEHPRAVFCTHISNVTGYILPIRDIFNESKKYSALNVLDTAQSLGLVEINAQDLCVDLIAFTGHKTLYGPVGIGGFVNVSDTLIDEVIVGGTGSDSLNLDMPQKGSQKYEAASQNIVAISGLNEALKVLSIKDNYEHEKELTLMLVEKLSNIENVSLCTSVNENNHVGIVSFVVDSMNSEDVAMIFDEDFDIAVRAGYHCAPFIHKYLNDEKYLGTVRIGLSRFNTVDDVEKLISAIKEICAE